MNRPYIFCHMLTSIDGKIMGLYMETPEGEAAGTVFYNLAFGKKPHYRHQGWISGRITTDDNFTNYRQPELDENAPLVPEGDYIAEPKAPMYYVSIDPSGKLGWESNLLTYEETTAHVVENQTAKLAQWQDDLLAELLATLSGSQVDMDALGFSKEEIDARLNADTTIDWATEDDILNKEIAARWAVIPVRVPAGIKAAMREALAAKAIQFHIKERNPAVTAGLVLKRILGLEV